MDDGTKMERTGMEEDEAADMEVAEI